MKNIKIVLVAALIAVAAGYNVYASQVKTEKSDIVMANIEALASNESGAKNYGPADEVRCVGGRHKKICLCKPGYPECTETDCY